MYFTPHQKKQLIRILILFVGLPLTVFATYKVVQYLTNAGAEAIPKGVVVSNVTTTSITISWNTEVKAEGSVIPVLNGVQGSPVIDKRGTGNRYTHYVELDDLEPNTKYDFLIVSDATKYSDEQGEDFSFNTAPVSTSVPTPNPVYGSIQNISGNDVVVYIIAKGVSAYPVSTIIPSGGNWVVDISALRKSDDNTLISTTDSTPIIVMARGGVSNGSVVQGTFSEVFNTEGKLNDAQVLSMTSIENLDTYFTQTLTVAQKEETPTTTTPTPSKPTTVVEEEPEEEEEEETVSGVYRIAKDVPWGDLVAMGGSANWEYGEDTIQITNLTDTGFTVSWVSEMEVEGSVVYGSDTDDLDGEEVDVRDGLTTQSQYYVHSVDVSRLQPQTKYFFKVVSGEDEYDNNGTYFSVTTYATQSSPPPFETVTGTVDGLEDLTDCVVVARIVGTTSESDWISVMPDENGSWILSIGDARDVDTGAYFEYSSGDNLEVSVISTGSADTVEISLGEADDILLEINSVGMGIVKIGLLEDYGILTEI